MKVKLNDVNAKLPKYSDDGASGMDFYSAQSGIIWPFTQKMISTGVYCELPEGVYLRMAPRSGLAVKNSIHVMAGVIDPNYRGEIKIILRNLGFKPYKFSVGDRIAQGILERYLIDTIEEVETLSDTDRNENGFGSTGK